MTALTEIVINGKAFEAGAQITGASGAEKSWLVRNGYAEEKPKAAKDGAAEGKGK